METELQRIVSKRLQELDRNPFEATRIGGLERSFVNDILNGKKKSVRGDNLTKLALALDMRPEEIISPRRLVEMVGYVGAGARTHYYGDADPPREWVEAPDNATEKTVAVQIRGDSLGQLFDGWYAFYDDRRDPPDDSMIGRMCICRLADEDRVLVKALKRSQIQGRWTLLSNTEQPIYDVALEWAAVVIDMRPGSTRHTAVLLPPSAESPPRKERPKPASRVVPWRRDR